MIEHVCDILKTRITGDWTDRVVGHTERVSIMDEGKPVYFPFEHGVTECNMDSAVTPDNKYKSVVWFASLNGVKPEEGRGGYNSRIRVFCWLDIKKLNSGDRRITSAIMADLIGKMKTPPITDGNLRISKVSFSGMPSKSTNLFSAYSFKDSKHYFFGDYDYFAIDFDVKFSMNCDVTLNESPC